MQMTSTAARTQSVRSLTPPDRAGVERPFAVEELFFSTTDRKGIIRSGNEVFVRVSGYARDELVGRAHNIVRHPDMPRAVFEVLWDRLHAGEAVAAYVKNRAADGSYYWVLATVDQAADGYLSVRLKPSSELFDAARSIYADVLAVERAAEAGDVRRRKAAIEAGVERLLELLAGAGFADYHEFQRAIVPAEVNAREAALAAAAGARLGEATAGADQRLAGILRACVEIHALLDALTANLERYRALHDTLAPKSAYVHDLADGIRLFSLNALLAATRLGARGAALGAVADIMGARSHTAGPITDALGADIAGAVDVLAGMGYRVAVSKVQTETLMVFVRELLDRAGAGDGNRGDLALLAQGLGVGVRRLCASLADLREHMGGITHNAGRLGGELRVLSRLEINGRIEAARLSDAVGVRDLFRTIGQQVETAHEQLADFAIVDDERSTSEEAAERLLLERLAELEQRVEGLGG